MTKSKNWTAQTSQMFFSKSRDADINNYQFAFGFR